MIRTAVRSNLLRSSVGRVSRKSAATNLSCPRYASTVDNNAKPSSDASQTSKSNEQSNQDQSKAFSKSSTDVPPSKSDITTRSTNPLDPSTILPFSHVSDRIRHNQAKNSAHTNQRPMNRSRSPFIKPIPGSTTADSFKANLDPNESPFHVLHVKASFNNTIITLTDRLGNTVTWGSGGTAGFKKAQRAGYEAAFQATKIVLDKTVEKLGDMVRHHGLHMRFKGFGPGKDAAWKAVRSNGWAVKMVEDATPMPLGGGCRPPKQRRL